MEAASDFSCAICLDAASEPVVTRCGHLFCWGCLDQWLHSKRGGNMCPVCKGRVDEALPGDIIPLYGKGKKTKNDPRPQPIPVPAASSSAAAAAGGGGGDASATTTASNPSDPAVRDTSYHFNFVRRDRSSASGNVEDVDNAANTTSTTATGTRNPRPTAPRAPTPPPVARQHLNRQFGDSPFPLGGFFIFFSGSVPLSLLMILCWAVYSFLPWRPFVEQVQRRIHQARTRGLTAFFETPPNRNPHAGASNQNNNNNNNNHSGNPATRASDAGQDGSAANQTGTQQPQQPQGVENQVAMERVARYAVLCLVAFMVVTNLLF